MRQGSQSGTPVDSSSVWEELNASSKGAKTCPLTNKNGKGDELKRRNIERKCALKEQYLSEERKYEEEYAALVADQPIEVTPHNLALLARHLNSENWGVWRLPELMVGYSAHQYDCDGKTATTITLDAPIMIGGELVTKLQYGAPRGHLRDYTPIAREL